MKNLIIMLSIFIFIFIACQQEKSEKDQQVSEEIASTFDSTSLKTTQLDNDEVQSFFLKYKFFTGNSVRYRMSVISSNEQHLNADTNLTNVIEQKMIYVIDLKTISIDEDSTAELQCTFSSINIHAKANANEISYQSGSVKDSTEKMKFAEYEALVNNSFNIRINSTGEIKDVYKLDKIVDDYLGFRNLTDSVKTEEKTTLKSDLSIGSIKPLLEQIFREVPEHRMAVDSTWSYKRESIPVMVFQIHTENIYKISNLEQLGNDKLAVINGVVKTTVEGKQDYTERGIKYQFDKPVSSASGKIYFNIDKGLIQKSRTQTRVETSYKMEMPSPQEIKKGSVKQIVTNTNIVELL